MCLTHLDEHLAGPRFKVRKREGFLERLDVPEEWRHTN